MLLYGTGTGGGDGKANDTRSGLELVVALLRHELLD